jgi:membrane-bound lytic murein transglycosylase D
MKSNNKSLALVVLIALCFLVIFAIVDRWNAAEYAQQISRIHLPAPMQSTTKNITDLQVPQHVTLFGEQLPLDNWYIREQFERDFYYNWSNASSLVAWWQRSGQYFPLIEKLLHDAGLPDDLKYLAVAESGLANVKSPANALGFWQFIPGTAQRLGLRVDDLIDERLDPEKATRAAIAYFKYMKAKLPTWTLVAAGYNMGEDNVAQAMQWQHATSYWNLFLNDETMRYVFRIAAIKELMSHGANYGLDFSQLAPDYIPELKHITVNGPIASIADWAFSQGFLYKDVKVLNPWLIGRSIPKGTYDIALPSTDEDRASIK